LAIYIEQLVLMENDLHHCIPENSEIRICEMAIREVSRFAVDIVDKINADAQSKM